MFVINSVLNCNFDLEVYKWLGVKLYLWSEPKCLLVKSQLLKIIKVYWEMCYTSYPYDLSLLKHFLYITI